MKMAFLLLLVLISFPCQTSSCKDTSDRIIADCQEGKCSDVFFVKAKKTFRNCQRRPTVTEPPYWAKDVIEKEILNSDLIQKSGVYELSMQYDWYCPVRVINADDYFIHKNNKFSRNGIRTELKHISDMSYLMLLSDWQDQEVLGEKKQALLMKTNTWIAYFISFCLICVVLVMMVHGIKTRIIWELLFTGAGLFLIFLYVLINMRNDGLDILLLVVPGMLVLNAYAVLNLIYDMVKSRKPIT